MATLQSLNGATLVPGTNGLITGIGQGAQLGAMYDQSRQRRQQQEAAQAIAGLTPKALKGSTEALAKITQIDKTGKIAPVLVDILERQDKETAAKFLDFTNRAATTGAIALRTQDPIERRDIFLREAKKFKDEGDEVAAQESLKIAQMAVTDPNAFNSEVMQDILVSKEAKNLLDFAGMSGGDGGGDVAAVEEFKYLSNELPKDQLLKAKQIKLGLTPRAQGSADQTIAELGIAYRVADSNAIIKEREKFGEMTGTSRAKTIDKGYDRIMTINSGIGSIDRAIKAVESGAGTGAVEKLLPSIKAASVELDQLRNQMALDVISGVTLGAISEGELALVQQVALPTGLNGPELIRHLKDRKQAQEKLRDYFKEQIDFLDQGGTVAGFVRQKEREMQGQGSGSTQNNDNTFTSSSGVTFTVK